MLIRAGSTIYLVEPESSEPHLWIVLTDPVGKPAQVVRVMLMTSRRHTDSTVILQPGDHPFIRHPTSVHYSTAVITTIDDILDAIEKRRCWLRESLSRDLLTKLQDGLFASPFTVNRMRQFCEKCLGRGHA